MKSFDITGEQIRSWREGRGLSREAVARLCNVSASTVANWELGRNKPHGPAAERIESLIRGSEAVVPLSPQEERILDELVKRTGFANREEYLTALLVDQIKNSSPPPT